MAGFVLNRPRLFAVLGRIGRFGQMLHPLIEGSLLDPARAWTATRDTPKLAPRSFRDHWATRPKKS